MYLKSAIDRLDSFLKSTFFSSDDEQKANQTKNKIGELANNFKFYQAYYSQQTGKIEEIEMPLIKPAPTDLNKFSEQLTN